MHRNVFLLLVAATFAFAACSDDTARPPTFDGGKGEGIATCSPATCSGCCLGNICTEGNAQSACGSAGGSCVECNAGLVCQTGKCVPSAQGCSATNCPGCCQGDTCRSGVGNDACGQAGAACVDCATTGAVCSGSTRTCLTSCTPNCTGKCAGADDGCNGTCQVNDCRGCCVGDQCAPGISNAVCGKDGSQCSDCSKTAGSTCTGGACSSCTPNCTGKCPGASDECGGTCKTSDCAGCCVGYVCEIGSADSACGATGANCADCTAQGTKCTGGKCGAACVADCKGKCAGASDGCGGTCTANQCTGCCDNGTCLPGISDTACGSAGAKCYVCPTDYQGYKWKCDASQTCVKDSPTTGTDCTGKTGGTTDCTDNGQVGKCWDGACCTGCYDGSLSICWKYANTFSSTCGTGGIACVDCTASSKVCTNYLCELPTGPCAGKQDLDTCTDGSKTGKCVANTCCTGCYYYDAGTLKCSATPTKAHCGKDAASCTSCKGWEFCDPTPATCEPDPAAKFELIGWKAELIDDPAKKWDSIGGAEPDPYLGLVWKPTNCSSNSLDKCSGHISNTFLPIWSYSLGIKTVAELLGDHCVWVLDSDSITACLPPYEKIGECKLTIDKDSFRQGWEDLYSCPNPNDSKNYVDYLAFDLIYKP